MNKPIKLTCHITHPNKLLNKFILYKYDDNSLYLYYIYSIKNSNDIFAYNLFYKKGEIAYDNLWYLNLHIINSHIYNTSLDDCCTYEMYIF